MDSSWIKWEGGDRPHPGGTPVEVQFRNGKIESGVSAFVRWWHEDSPSDIIYYRLPTHVAQGHQDKSEE